VSSRIPTYIEEYIYIYTYIQKQVNIYMGNERSAFVAQVGQIFWESRVKLPKENQMKTVCCAVSRK